MLERTNFSFEGMEKIGEERQLRCTAFRGYDSGVYLEENGEKTKKILERGMFVYKIRENLYLERDVGIAYFNLKDEWDIYWIDMDDLLEPKKWLSKIGFHNTSVTSGNVKLINKYILHLLTSNPEFYRVVPTRDKLEADFKKVSELYQYDILSNKEIKQISSVLNDILSRVH